METASMFDVVQIGCGPIGQTNTALLRKLGRSLAVFEGHSNLFSLPCANSIFAEKLHLLEPAGGTRSGRAGRSEIISRYSGNTGQDIVLDRTPWSEENAFRLL
jgi:hypothetical protein